MLDAFSIGLSALSAGQTALNLIGQNIANASTPGYHQQAVNLVSTTSGGKIGTGVDVATLTRYTAAPARTAILSGNAVQSAVSTNLDTSQQIESTIGAGTGGIADGLTSFFNQLTSLTTTPDDSSVRIPVVSSASDLAQQFNTAASSLDQLRGNLGGQITQSVSQINTLATQIASLNTQIATATESGSQPNDLLDQRDELIDQLSQQIDVTTVQQPHGEVNVLSSGAPIVVGTYANQFQAAPDASGNYQITQTGVVQPVTVSSGQLGGLIQDYNQTIPAATSQLDSVARGLISSINEVQATGLGTSGPITSTSGTVSVPDPTQPLAAQNLPFPIQAGQLTVSVTDSSGNRTNTTLNIDPATQSLQDIATALSGVPGLTASVDPASGTLQIASQPGFSFDFAGRDTNPPGGGAVANPDTANILSGLGVNGFFTGTDATSIAVNPAIVSNPSLLAASKTGEPGDGTNLDQMAAVASQPVVSGQTISGAYTNLATGIGSNVNTLTDQQTAQTGVLQNLNAQEQAVTGVDVNQQMVNLLSFQQMIQGASQYMSAVNTALDSIMNIVHD